MNPTKTSMETTPLDPGKEKLLDPLTGAPQ